MTQRIACPPAPGPLEAYAARFDDLFTPAAPRRGFRAYRAGLLLPRDRHKTLTALAGAEPIVEAPEAPVQRLQSFLSESVWDAAAVTARRLALIWAEAAIRPHAGGVLVIDETGDRKDGTKTAHVAPPYLGARGKIANGIVSVTSLGAAERVHDALHVVPYTPAARLPRGKKDPHLRTKPPPRSTSSPVPGTWACPSARSWPLVSTAKAPPSRAPGGARACPTCWRCARRAGRGGRRTPHPPRGRGPRGALDERTGAGRLDRGGAARP